MGGGGRGRVGEERTGIEDSRTGEWEVKGKSWRGVRRGRKEKRLGGGEWGGEGRGREKRGEGGRCQKKGQRRRERD